MQSFLLLLTLKQSNYSALVCATVRSPVKHGFPYSPDSVLYNSDRSGLYDARMVDHVINMAAADASHHPYSHHKSYARSHTDARYRPVERSHIFYTHV